MSTPEAAHEPTRSEQINYLLQFLEDSVSRYQFSQLIQVFAGTSSDIASSTKDFGSELSKVPGAVDKCIKSLGGFSVKWTDETTNTEQTAWVSGCIDFIPAENQWGMLAAPNRGVEPRPTAFTLEVLKDGIR